MNPAGKLAGFVAVLGLALGGGAAVGNAVGPLDADGDDGAGGMAEHDGADAGEGGAGDGGGTAQHDGSEAGGEGAGHGESEAGGGQGEAGGEGAVAGEAAEATPGGVLVSQAGYTLEPEHTIVDGAPGTPFRFRIAGPDGAAVHDFDVAHERELHLIVVGRDLRAYAHLHPTLAGDGTWTVDLPALEPGAYRAFADFAVAGGPDLTLGVDLTVPGAARPAPVPEAAGTTAVDGYDVALAGTPAAGAESEVELTVRRGGEPVTDLEPYLGAAGHLVAIRGGDLAYLHVHPLDEVGERNGPGVRFAVEVPSPGTYRLFFDFAHRGEVRTAAFTVHVPAAGGQPAAAGHAHEEPQEER